MPKYRFKQEYRDTIISIPALRLNITRFNLTDELAEKILKKFPAVAHNLELVPKEDPKPAPKIVEDEHVEENYDLLKEEAGGDMEYPVEEELKKKVKEPKPKGVSKKGKKSKDK